MDLLFHPKFSAEKLELAQQQEATAIVRRNDDEDGIAGRESAKLVYGVNSPYTRQPELATIGAVTLADLRPGTTARSRESSSWASAATSTRRQWKPRCARSSRGCRPSRRSRPATMSLPDPHPACTSSTKRM